MGITRGLRYAIIILSIHIAITNEEIHRAKISSARTNGNRGRDKTLFPDSDVAEKAGRVTKAASTVQIEYSGNMFDFTDSAKIEVWTYSILGAMLVGLSGIFPLLVIPIEAGPALKHGAAAAKLKLFLSFAVGGLLGDVFLHLLPEAWQNLPKDVHGHDGHNKIGMWVLTGILTFLIIEKVFAKEGEFEVLEDECDEREADTEGSDTQRTDSKGDNSEISSLIQGDNSVSSKQDGRTRKRLTNNGNKQENKVQNGDVVNNVHYTNNNTKHIEKTKEDSIKISGYLNLSANVIDNFTHGLAVAAGFLVSNKVGFVTLLAILLHEIPHEIGDFAILLRSGFDRWKAAQAQVLTASGGVVGALTALTADSAQAAGESTAWILPFTSGGFIYIALVTVVPDLLQEKHGRESIKQVVALVAGITAMYFVSLIH